MKEFDSWRDSSGIERGGPDYDFVGLPISTIFDKFPDLRIGDIRKMVADKLNTRFGTSFTEDDISYFEEGWYDG